jgi:hypothetical protein
MASRTHRRPASVPERLPKSEDHVFIPAEPLSIDVTEGEVSLGGDRTISNVRAAIRLTQRVLHEYALKNHRWMMTKGRLALQMPRKEEESKPRSTRRKESLESLEKREEAGNMSRKQYRPDRGRSDADRT